MSLKGVLWFLCWVPYLFHQPHVGACSVQTDWFEGHGGEFGFPPPPLVSTLSHSFIKMWKMNFQILKYTQTETENLKETLKFPEGSCQYSA